MPAARDLTGQRFGNLVAIARDGAKERADTVRRDLAGKVARRRAFWQCRCDCGASTSVLAAYLTTGGTKSCGCLRRESGREHARQMRAVLAIRGRAFERTADAFADVFGKQGPREVDRGPKEWRNASSAAADLAACLGLPRGPR